MGLSNPTPTQQAGTEAVKENVQAFYDQVGWQKVGGGYYQNASYEDLRPVAAEYIHRCHFRVLRYLSPQGKFLLDAGSGPIQYLEYLEYSRGYQYRVCADISNVALQEARKRIGEHGLFVVADVANLPFRTGAFDGLVSLHTIHHLPEAEHPQAYGELHRVLSAGASGVIVNGWKISPLMRLFNPLVRRLKKPAAPPDGKTEIPAATEQANAQPGTPHGTFVSKNNAAWLRDVVGRTVPLEIYCWRSVSVGFMRALIQPQLGGRFWLRLIYGLEELFPKFFGEKGQYPLVVIRKPGAQGSVE
jgi:SAM-dependent methyltransferase